MAERDPTTWNPPQLTLPLSNAVLAQLTAEERTAVLKLATLLILEAAGQLTEVRNDDE